MKKVLTILLAICGMFFIVSCNKEKAYSIIGTEPQIAPYQEYNLNDILNLKEGVTYTATGTYLTSRGLTKNITITDGAFMVPENGTVAEFEVAWQKGSQSKTEILKLSVIGEDDVIDCGMRDVWAEDSISKILNYNPAYIKDGKTSIKVTFNGYYNSFGTQYACVTGHLSNKGDSECYDKQYFDIYKEDNLEEAFKDCIYYFWVYNTIKPSATIESSNIRMGFRLRTHDDAVNLDWSNDNAVTCAAGEWTLVPIRLKNYGVTTDLYKDLDSFYAVNVANFGDTYDALNLKVVGDNLTLGLDGKPDTTIKQNYTFYIDGHNMVSYAQFKAKFPDYDIDSIEMGDTWQSNVVGTVDNWKTSGKGISFDFVADGTLLNPNVFSLLQSDWKRLTEHITLDFQECTASKGTLTQLQNGKYHYEVYFEDLALNTNDNGFTATGAETFSMIYFKSYPNKMTISNYKIITK